MAGSSMGEPVAPVGSSGNLVQPQERAIAPDHTVQPEDPWAFKIILSLDGGGVRGYGSLLMLRDLMRRVEEKEKEADRGRQPHDSSFAPYPQPLAKPRSGRSQDRSNDTTPRRSRSRSHRRSGDSTPVVREDVQQDTAGENDVPVDPLSPNDREGYYPCHYFDYIGGTSTGGLNAIMLGRLRMTVDQCLLNYPDMADNIFNKPRSQIHGYPRNKHNAALLVKEIQKLMKARTGQEENEKSELHYFKSPEDLCRTFVASKRELVSDTLDALHIFRTYDKHYIADVSGPADDELIWKVGRATSAAPTYFKPMQIGEDFFSDGGISYNNPTELAYYEVLSKEGYYFKKKPMEPLREPICLVLSIGAGGTDPVHPRQNNGVRENTGISEKDAARKARRRRYNPISHFKRLAKRLSGAATDTGRVDRDMRNKSQNGDWEYVRWHGGEHLAKLKLDEWKCKRRSRLGTREPKISTQEAIEEWVRTYMNDTARRDEIEKVAEILVDVRRRRTEYEAGDLWKRWTYCSKFICQSCGDDDYTKTGTMARLEKHQETCGTIPRTAFGPDIAGGPY